MKEDLWRVGWWDKDADEKIKGGIWVDGDLREDCLGY